MVAILCVIKCDFNLISFFCNFVQQELGRVCIGTKYNILETVIPKQTILETLNVLVQESPAEARVTRDSSACIKTPAK